MKGLPHGVHVQFQGVMTVLKFGGKFSKGVYQTSGGLHGVGA